MGKTERYTRHWFMLLGVAIIIALGSGVVEAKERWIEGKVTKVRDVDTIEVAGTPVRLNGVDGPETSNRYGRNARAFMRRLVAGKTVSCRLSGERTYDRWVGVCFLGDEDIGAVAISSGHALDCPRYSRGRYFDLETSAARQRLPRAGYCR